MGRIFNFQKDVEVTNIVRQKGRSQKSNIRKRGRDVIKINDIDKVTCDITI